MRCFCQKRVRLRLRYTTKNPHCLFLSCPKKHCEFFQWITTPLSLKITDHLLRILPARQEEEEESCAPKLLMDTPEYVTALQNGQASGKYVGGINKNNKIGPMSHKMECYRTATNFAPESDRQQPLARTESRGVNSLVCKA